MTEISKPLQLRIDIVSDVVCPWCIIGYLQLQKALDSLPGQFIPEIRWHPFELNPQMPAEGQNLSEHIRQKYGTSPTDSGGARDRLTELGASLGFTFDYHPRMRMVNTFLAHQLLHWAGIQGKQTELKLALFEAFFSNRQDVSQLEILVQLADAVGLDAPTAAAVLRDGRYVSRVREEQSYWQERDVYAVPTFFLQEKYVVPGAQEAAAFVRVLQKLRERACADAG